MPLQFRAPFQINPNAPSQESQSLERFGQTLNQMGQDASTRNRYESERKRQEALLELQRAGDRRAQEVHDYDYKNPGDPMASGGYSMPSPMGPQPSGYSPNGTMGPMPTVQGPQPMGAVDHSYGVEGPQPEGAIQAPSLIERFNQWHGQQNKQPSPMDSYSQVMNMPGAKRRAEGLNFMKESRAMQGQEADTNLKRAQAKWYEDRYKGPPGSVLRASGGGGANDPSRMTTANITALRNQVSDEILYAVPNSEDYNQKMEYMAMLDDELQNRLTRNRTPRVSRQGAPQRVPSNTPPSVESGNAAAWLQQNYPDIQNPTSADLAWARKKMSNGNR